jgi:MurE/MurF fusion protein
MLLKYLIKNPDKKFENLRVKGLALNSKNVKKGFIFFAIKGKNSNGEKYINLAIKKGALVIVCSKSCNLKNSRVNIVKVSKVREYLSEVASKFYKLKPKNIIAVTGTNGKTSVADFFYQILKANKIPVASIGTLGIKYKKNFIKTNLTSPDIIDLHENLEKIKKNKIENVIIEASSHGLDQKRLNNIKFKAGIFTNFSQDHLDYHKTMKAYFKAKLNLFSKLLPKRSYVITDTSIKQYSIIKKISQKRKLRILNIKSQLNYIKNIKLPLVGLFQMKNLSMAILSAELCGLKNIKIRNTLKKIRNVEGRLNLIKKYPDDIRVFIDYAHTPEALSEVIQSLKRNYNNNISLVFGCGGERDCKKRPLMAKIAKKFCHKIYVTDDNPRKENPEKIRKEIIKHLKGCNYFNIGNRRKAVSEAILSAKPNETILIAGKGHENYQDYGHKKLNISDKEIVNKVKARNDKINKKNLNYLLNLNILNKITKNKFSFKINELTINSRKVKKNNLFLAIKGKNHDGNKFVAEALQKGASSAVSTSIEKKNSKKIIITNDSINFLKKFAQLKRDNCSAKILAITGSVGKTSLKNMLNILLQKYGKTYASPRSFNNHLGVPLSLSNLNLDHQFGVFEVGMSKIGEINTLSKMIKPNLAIITNIAEAHIENFKNIQGIASAKSEIINNIQNKGTIILNRDDRFFRFLDKKAKLKNLKVITFGKSKKSDVSLVDMKKSKELKKIVVKIDGKLLKLEIKNINIYNLLASLAVLKELNLDILKITQTIKEIQPFEGRGKIHKINRYKKNFKLIDESYNASPLSMKNALYNFSEIKKNNCKKYLLLGDMLELGKRSEIYHINLSKLINSSDIDKVFIKGEKTLFTYKNLKKEKQGNIFQCNQDIDTFLKNIIANNDYLMIKGSNATGLNMISNAMIKGSLNVI